MVEPIKRTDSRENILDVPYALPRPQGVVIRFGRAIVVLVETSKKTLQLFQDSVEQIREFIEGIRFALVHTGKGFFASQNAIFSDYYPNEIQQYPLRTAPRWQLHVQEPRACKQLKKLNEPLLRITKKALQVLTGKNPGTSPIQTAKFGAGIPNGQNCCFMASVLQALRFSPSFRTRIKANELRSMPVIQELLSIYKIIEGSKGTAKRNLSSDEIDHFRTTCVESGFHIDSYASQEDSSHFCQFLLSQVGFEEFQIKEQNEHSLGFYVNALDKGRPLSENQVVIQIAESESSEVKDLVHKRKIVVEIEKKHVVKDLEEKGLLTDEILAKLAVMKDVELISVKQSMQFYKTNLPPVFPLLLERGNYDMATGQNSINTRKIVPNNQIDITLADAPGYSARYEWISAVTREQAVSNKVSQVINKDSGHYAAWARCADPQGKNLFAQYDSTATRLHTSTAGLASNNIDQNSRILIYEFRGIVKV